MRASVWRLVFHEGFRWWAWLWAAPLAVVGGAVAVAVTVGPSHAAARAAPVPAATGRLVYLRDCAVCHGADARGTSYGPSLQGVGLAAVDYWVTTGRMPLVANARPAQSPANQAPPGQRLADSSATPRRGPPAYPPQVIAALEAYVATIAPGGPGIPTVNLAGVSLPTGGESVPPAVRRLP